MLALAILWQLQQWKQEKNAPSKVLNFNEQDATAWSAKWREERENGRNGEKIHFISLKKNGSWHIVAPTNAPADQGESAANVKNFLSLEVIETFGTLKQLKSSENKVEIDPLALDVSASDEVFTIDYIKDKKPHHFSLQVIKKHNVLQAYFVFFDEKIHLVTDWYILALRKSLDDVVEKDFLKIEPRKIVRIETDDYVLVKRKLYYELLGNKQKTSVEKIDQLVQNLGFLTAERAVTDAAEQKLIATKKNILQRFTIDLNDRRKIKLIIFYVDQKEKSGVYAKIDDKKSPLLYEIDAKNLASFSMKKKDFLLN